MSGEEIENAFTFILNALIKSDIDDVEENYGKKIKELVKSKYQLLKDVEYFDVYVNYQLDKIFRIFVKELYPDAENNKIQKLFFLYRNYDYIENNIRNLIKNKDGWPCSADKSRWLMQSYKKYILENVVPDMTIEEKCYWKPTFGTGQQWMDFCDGLFSLYCGHPVKYLKSFYSLIGG